MASVNEALDDPKRLETYSRKKNAGKQRTDVGGNSQEDIVGPIEVEMSCYTKSRVTWKLKEQKRELLQYI